MDDEGTPLEQLTASWERALRARNLAPKTVTVYGESARQLTAWLGEQRVDNPDDVTKPHVEAFITGLLERRTAGCTPTIDRHHGVMSTMGERFVIYRHPPVDGGEQVARALQRWNEDGAMRAELAEAMRGVLDLADVTAVPHLSPEDVRRLTACSELAARGRSPVERDGYSREIELIPEPEAPARIALVLRRMLDGLTAIGVERDDAWQLGRRWRSTPCRSSGNASSRCSPHGGRPLPRGT